MGSACLRIQRQALFLGGSGSGCRISRFDMHTAQEEEMKRLCSLLLSVVCGLGLMAGSAQAKDEQLLQDLVVLEKAYIPPLFFTSAKLMAPAVKSMNDYVLQWREFSDRYYFYKPDYANWQTYFEQIEVAVQAAETIVKTAAATGDVEILPLAHEELEAVRMVMLQMRPKNGFPKIITDKLTVFHEPMEHLVLSVKGKTPAQIDEATLVDMEETLKEAWKAWETALKCPVDFALWKLTPAQVSNYLTHLYAETAALENLEQALASGDKLAIIQAGMGVKPSFVEVYKTFGNFALYVSK